jgi:hypothetical protein
MVALSGCLDQSPEGPPTPTASAAVAEIRFTAVEEPPESYSNWKYDSKDWAILSEESTSTHISIQGNIPWGNEDCYHTYLDKVTYQKETKALHLVIRVTERDYDMCGSAGWGEFYYRAEATMKSESPVRTVDVDHYFRDKQKLRKSFEISEEQHTEA